MRSGQICVRSVSSSSCFQSLPYHPPEGRGSVLISGAWPSDPPLLEYCYFHLPNHHYSTKSRFAFCHLMHFFFSVEMGVHVSFCNLSKGIFILKLPKSLIPMLIPSSLVLLIYYL